MVNFRIIHGAEHPLRIFQRCPQLTKKKKKKEEVVNTAEVLRSLVRCLGKPELETIVVPIEVRDILKTEFGHREFSV